MQRHASLSTADAREPLSGDASLSSELQYGAGGASLGRPSFAPLPLAASTPSGSRTRPKGYPAAGRRSFPNCLPDPASLCRISTPTARSASHMSWRVVPGHAYRRHHRAMDLRVAPPLRDLARDWRVVRSRARSNGERSAQRSPARWWFSPRPTSPPATVGDAIGGGSEALSEAARPTLPEARPRDRSPGGAGRLSGQRIESSGFSRSTVGVFVAPSGRLCWLSWSAAISTATLWPVTSI